ncbi:MAG: hypothetical protein HFG00_07415 [Oscillibacter sp.]|nr:hypothetical protein [Oscillibacter sp.]
MRQWTRGLGLCLTALLTGLEAWLVRCWLWGRQYLQTWGAAENPYAAEDTEMAGLLALLVLPLCLTALAWTVYAMVLKDKAGKSPDGEIEARDNADNIL